MLDELGSRIQHSDEPSIKMVPFFYTANKTALSIFWLLQDLDAEGLLLTRPYLLNIIILLAYFSRCIALILKLLFYIKSKCLDLSYCHL